MKRYLSVLLAIVCHLHSAQASDRGETAPWDDLPDEVIVHILSYVPDMWPAKYVNHQWERCALEAMKDSYNQEPQTKLSCEEVRDKWAQERANAIYRNWRDQDGMVEPSHPTLTKCQVGRLNRLPFEPPRHLDSFSASQYRALALDAYDCHRSFFMRACLPCLPTLLTSTQTLKNMYIKVPPTEQLIQALQTSCVTRLQFADNTGIQEDQLDKMISCRDHSGAHQVTAIDIKSCTPKQSHNSFLKYLQAFPNLNCFESVSAFDLSLFQGSLPPMTKLHTLELSYNNTPNAFLKAVLQSLQNGHLPCLKQLTICPGSDVWGKEEAFVIINDGAVADVLQIISEYPQVELDIFLDSGFSEQAMEHICDALVKQNYPYRLSSDSRFSNGKPELPCVTTYNEEWRQRQ